MRKSRARQYVNWTKMLDSIPKDGMIEIKHPNHLTVFQTRDLIEKLALNRGWQLETMVILGYLHARRIS